MKKTWTTIISLVFLLVTINISANANEHAKADTNVEANTNVDVKNNVDTKQNVKQVALTIDDLPFVGDASGNEGNLRREKERFNLILQTLKEENIPVIGFVVPGSIEKGQWDLLKEFHDSGFLIANHTYNHMNLNRAKAENFIENISRADKILEPYYNQQKYFRYPYLATGRNCHTKVAVRKYLLENNYVIAPVTIDTKDFRLNQQYYSVHWRKRKSMSNYFRKRYVNTVAYQINRAERRAMKVEKRPIKHIVLIHMNTINAYFLKDIIKLFREKGYEFIPLSEALKDPYYTSDNDELTRIEAQCASE